MIHKFYLLVTWTIVCGLTGCATNSIQQEVQDAEVDPPLTNPKRISNPISADTETPSEFIGSLSLSSALSRVLTDNPILKSYSLDIQSANARRIQAGLYPNPELSVGMEEFGGQGPRRSFDGVETTLAITQPVEMGGKRDKRSQVAVAEKTVAERDYQLTRLDVIKQTRQTFSEVAGWQQQVDLAQEQMDLAEQLLQSIQQRVEAGKDSPAEAAKAQISLAQAQGNVQQAQQDYSDACQRLALLWGAAHVDFEQVEDIEEEPIEFESLTSLQEQAQQHPRILRWREVVALERSRLKLTKAQSRSNVAVTAGLKRLEQDGDNTGILGIAIPLPVFNRNQGAIASAQYELAKVQERLHLAQAQVQSNLTQAYQRWQTAQSYATLVKDNILVNAESVFDTVRKQHAEGKADYLELLDAQRTLFQTQAQVIQAVTAVQVAQADLHYAFGLDAN